MKERWFNYRPLCLIFTFLLLGSVFSFYLTNHAAFSIIMMVLVAGALLLLSIIKKKPKYFLIPLISFIFGVSAYHLAISSFKNTIDYTPSTVQARIYAISNEKDGMIMVEADSCVFDGNKVNDNIKIFIYDNDGLFDKIEVGSIVEFVPYRFYESDLFFFETPSSSLYANDLKYTASALIDDVKYLKTDKTVAEHIKGKIKDNLTLGLTNENAEIAYSALFGDKDLLSDKQYNAYKLSGVAHLLAVSGLHVGIIVEVISKILNFRKSKKWWKFGIVATLLLMYTHLCGYSVSIIRASIMSLILMISQILGKEYDPFNSISLAGIVIFAINPLCVFDPAFLLSFACVIGITMLYMPIENALLKTKISPKIVKSLAMSLSTTIAIVIIMAYYFRTLNIISIIANVILIPIFTIGFTIVFAVSFVSFFIPYLSYILYPVNYIFNSINIVATVLGNLSISNFNTIRFNYIAIIIYFVFLLFLGRFCTAKYQYKVISSLSILALLFCCLL